MAERPTLAFCGMSHLGLTSAVAAAAKGFPTTGFDADEALIQSLQDGQPPVVEPDLPLMMADAGNLLTFSSQLESLAACDVIYVAADVPTDDTGRSDLSGIETQIARLLPALREDACLVVLSQVPPGFTRAIRRDPAKLFYQVETLIFGRAMERALHPERFIVGCTDPEASLPDAYRKFLDAFDCPILAMRYESAEFAKIAINMCLIASVSAANMMAELCEEIGADWSEIVPALRLDRRIGEFSYINAGLGLSGGNLERDLATVLRLAEAHDTDGGIAAAWMTNSRRRKGWANESLRRYLGADAADATIAVLGLAYKQDTHSTKNSPALRLIDEARGYRVRAYDPVVPATVAGSEVAAAGSPLEAADGADAVLIMTPWPAFRELVPADLASRMRGSVVIDPYRVLDGKAVRAAGLTHVVLGAPPSFG